MIKELKWRIYWYTNIQLSNWWRRYLHKKMYRIAGRLHNTDKVRVKRVDVICENV